MDIFEFNFELFDSEIFSLTVTDNIFFDDEIEEPLSQPNFSTLFTFEPDEDDTGVTFDQLQTLARSNRPDVAEAARKAIEDIEIEAGRLDIDFNRIDATTFPTPTIIEDLGGIEFERKIGQGASEEFKEAARQSLGGGGGGGGGGGSSYGGSDPSDYLYRAEKELEVYLDEWESDDWQLLRAGVSVETVLIEKWESANSQDWYEYLSERDELDDGDF